MKIIGLTGQSGAGKGEVCSILQKYGIPSIDTDALYHRLLAESAPLKDELIAAFGADITDACGAIDRKRLAAAVFDGSHGSDRLHTLNAITHKYIMAEVWAIVQDFAKKGARAAVIDAPQLFEAGVDADCDILLGVVAAQELRLSRVVTRDGLSPEAVSRRFAAQHDEAFFRARCHYILENNADTATLELAVRRFLEVSDLGL
ncbi:MAG: dephospho-CoA kinase [Clostridia bacterium]|nr:dephospho-CoA kinase [Clostridia bacterium]